MVSYQGEVHGKIDTRSSIFVFKLEALTQQHLGCFPSHTGQKIRSKVVVFHNSITISYKHDKGM